MKRFALALLLLACGAGDGVAEQSTQEVQDAVDSWGVLEMCQVQLVAVNMAGMARECNNNTPLPEDASVLGCAKKERCEILILEGLEPELRAAVLVHEVGHLIRPEHGHLTCPKGVPIEDVMCPAVAHTTIPTERDRAFVGAP